LLPADTGCHPAKYTGTTESSWFSPLPVVPPLKPKNRLEWATPDFFFEWATHIFPPLKPKRRLEWATSFFSGPPKFFGEKAKGAAR